MKIIFIFLIFSTNIFTKLTLEEIDLSSLGIDLKLENNSNSDPESKLEKSISEEE